MYHRLTTIAETHKISPDKFLKFAEENKEKFGIINEGCPNTWIVSTWHVNELVKIFINSLNIKVNLTA